MQRKMILILAALPLGACGAQSEPDTLERLRASMDDTIDDDAHDAELWTLTRQVADEKKLVGMSRAEVVAILGDGAPCAGKVPDAWTCGDGLGAEDLRYEIGKLPAILDGGTPMLLVDFDEHDTVIGTRALHGQ